MAWRRISWDEWPQQEAADKPTAIRNVLNRLTNRAADFDAKILLTGTITPETEHIAQEWIDNVEDPQNPDWTGSSASRMDNPHASRKAMDLAERTFDPEDYARMVLGTPGGVKGRLLPPFMVDPIYSMDLPRFTPPHPADGAIFEGTPAARILRPGRRQRSDDEEPEAPKLVGRWRTRDGSPFTHFHVWDLAIAQAANVGFVIRAPADWQFGWFEKDGERRLVPLIGVRRVEVPGSIEETCLP
jgi:hypothetical protein